MVKRILGNFILFFVLGLLFNSATRAEFVSEINATLFDSSEAANSLEQMKNPDKVLEAFKSKY